MERSSTFHDSISSNTATEEATTSSFKSSYDFYSSKEDNQSKKSRAVEHPRDENPSKEKEPGGKYFKLIDQSDINWFTKFLKRNIEKKPSSDASKSSSEKKSDQKFENSNSEKELDYTPILCPIFGCDLHYLPNDLLIHFLSFHYNRNAPARKLYAEQRLIMSVKPLELTPGQVICFGLVSYGGKNNKSSCHSFAERKGCIQQNLMTCPKFGNLNGDFPILILAGVISMETFSEQGAASVDVGFDENFPTLLMIWLAGTNINFRISASLTTYDEHRMYSRSVYMGLHSLSERQDPYELWQTSNSYFSLSSNEWLTYMNEAKSLKLELVLHED